MQKNENSLQPDNLQEIAAAQLSNPQAGEGKEDEFIMLPWQNKAHRITARAISSRTSLLSLPAICSR